MVEFDALGLIVEESFGDLLVPVSVNQQIDSTISVNFTVLAGSATDREG